MGFNLAQKVLSQKGKNRGLGAQTTLSPSQGPGPQQWDPRAMPPAGASAGSARDLAGAGVCCLQGGPRAEELPTRYGSAPGIRRPAASSWLGHRVTLAKSLPLGLHVTTHERSGWMFPALMFLERHKG